ncbi:MAG: hypothetical protein EA382_01880 [Spirochaetaceae bacterium]|nr:MAG: hypothetical protein EA382_01880 [Spirochaetaceae bacterium]
MIHRPNSPPVPVRALPSGLVDVARACPGVFVDLAYRRPDNVFGRALYRCNHAWLLAATAAKLVDAAVDASAHGHAIVILDAYRPLRIQRAMWELHPDDDFVAPPSRGSLHNRGAAVDVTLATPDGGALPMPSDYDEFSPRASHRWDGGPIDLVRRRELLRAIMERAGFASYHAEWWHYTDRENADKPLLDVDPCCDADDSREADRP